MTDERSVDYSLNIKDFQRDLEKLINQHSKENESNTPDWVLASYLVRCLEAFNACVNMRERYFGREHLPVEFPRDISSTIKDNRKKILAWAKRKVREYEKLINMLEKEDKKKAVTVTYITKCSTTKLLEKCNKCWRRIAPDSRWQSYSNCYDGCKNDKWEYYIPVERWKKT